MICILRNKKKTWPNTEHPGTGLFTRSVWRKYVPPFFLVLVVVTISRNHPNTPWFHRRCFGYNSNPPSKQNHQKKKCFEHPRVFSSGLAPPNFDALPFEHHKPDPLCYLLFRRRRLSWSNLSSSKITPILERLDHWSRICEARDDVLILGLEKKKFLCVGLKTSWCQNSTVYFEIKLRRPSFPHPSVQPKKHPPNTHHPLKWPWPSRDGTFNPELLQRFPRILFLTQLPKLKNLRATPFRRPRLRRRRWGIISSPGGELRNANGFICWVARKRPIDLLNLPPTFFSPSMKFSCRKINSFTPTFLFRKRIGRPYSP